VKKTIHGLTERAARGDKEAAETLAQWLAAHSEHKPSIRQFDDLAGRTEDAWVRAVAGEDLVPATAIREVAARLKADLLGRRRPSWTGCWPARW
jgi:hypothetical protein